MFTAIHFPLPKSITAYADSLRGLSSAMLIVRLSLIGVPVNSNVPEVQFSANVTTPGGD